MAVTVRFGDRELVVTLEADGRLTVEDATYTIAAIEDGVYRVSNGTRYWTVAVAGSRDQCWVAVNGHTATVEVIDASERGRTRRRAASHELTAPMPATVTRVAVAPNTAVKAGEVLLMLEAMKMELAIRAPQDGIVGTIHCTVGDLVQPGVSLLDFA